MKKIITILLSTYNGEKYISNQLYSLLQQTYKDWVLYIRDDGSTDDTVEIIKQFLAIDTRIHYVDDNKRRLGTGKSFWELLKYANSKYTICCDQDDIWLEYKLEYLVNFAENKLSSDKVGFVYCDGYSYSNEQGVITSNSISHLHASRLKDFIFFNSGYQGCSILFNNHLLQMAVDYKQDFYMHDDILSLLGIVFGECYFLDTPLMLYRQHAKQVTGNTKRSKLDMLKSFFDSGKCVISKAHYNEKLNFYNYYSNRLNLQDKQLFEAYFSYANSNLINRLKIILKHKFTIGGYFIVLFAKTILRKPVN